MSCWNVMLQMDSLCLYSEEVNKVSGELESGCSVREKDCIIDFTTDKVKFFVFVFVYVYEM